MPLIEELPVTNTVKASHGWAYVPDIGPIAAQQPGTRHDRRKAAASTARNAATSSAKREKAIQLRLDALNKENYKDVQIPIPPRPGRARAEKKVTPNVKRILGYQRNFAHYLADEEANHPGATHYTLPSVTTGMLPPPTPATATASTPSLQRNASKDAGRRRSSRAQTTAEDSPAPATPQPRGTKRKQSSQRTLSNASDSSPATAPKQEPDVKTEEESNTPALAPAPHTSTADAPPYPPSWDNDPLLTSHPSDVLPMPTDRIMQLLVSEPPLTYTAAKAKPETQQPPRRNFCAICGYWGRVKCRVCEDWTCGIMECWKAHGGVCGNGVGGGY